MDYTTYTIQKLINNIERNSIGMENWLDKIYSVNTEVNYPPYNTIKLNDNQFKVEVALAGFTNKEVTVYTENNKLYIEGHKEESNKDTYVHRGLATRAFTRSWTIPDDLKVKEVSFENGLLVILLSRIIPEHQKKKVWF